MKLKEYFTTTGVQQKFLADKAGISPSALNAYVLGKKIPNIETAWKIHKATNGAVTFQDWLLEECDIDSSSSVSQKTNPNKNTHPTKKNV